MNKNQGITPILIILIIIGVLAVVGGIGYYLLNQRNLIDLGGSDQTSKYSKIICEAEQNYTYDFGIDNDEPPLPCRDCPDGYFFEIISTKNIPYLELQKSRLIEVRRCVKPIQNLEHYSIDELNKVNLADGKYNTEGYIVWKRDCASQRCPEGAECALCLNEIIISNSNRIISDIEANAIESLGNDYLKMSAYFINTNIDKSEIGKKYQFSLKLTNWSSGDKKIKIFHGIGATPNKN